MSTDLVHAPASDLAIAADQTFWTEKQRAGLTQLGVANASNADLAVFFHQVRRTGLDPFLKQIYMLLIDGKQVIQTGIDGFRLIARRAVDRTRETLGYEDPLWCGPDGEWKQVWLDKEPPHAAAVVVLRNGNRFPAIALYNEYAIIKRDGQPNRTWTRRPAGQLEKCAEALALRKAFPQDLSGLYTPDEMRVDSPPEATWDAEVVEETTEVDGQEPLVDPADNPGFGAQP
jgi:phage recombination protein Bet